MKIKADTIARTICLGLALVNQFLAIIGKGQITFVDSEIYQAVSISVTIITTIAAWWKNNSFTQAAIKADEIMKEFKNDQVNTK